MKFATLYNHTRKRSELFGTANAEESLTQQSDKDDCDINIIMKKYGGAPQHRINPKSPLFGDFTNSMDYRTMVEKVTEANEAFQDIPADIRGRFLNDPQRFIDFANNKNNQDELIKLGLAEKPAPPAPPPEPMLVKVVNATEDPNAKP